MTGEASESRGPGDLITWKSRLLDDLAYLVATVTLTTDRGDMTSTEGLRILTPSGDLTNWIPSEPFKILSPAPRESR